MNILITGGTGFIGSAVIQRLLKTPGVGRIHLLTRNPVKIDARVKAFAWDAEKEVPPREAFASIDTVLHLAGENIAQGRWTPAVKKRILDSRELGTRNLVRGINLMPEPPTLVSISAAGIYGDRSDQVLTENSPTGTGFLAEVCDVWEAEAKKAKTRRLAIYRLGVVLGKDGGMIPKVLPLFRAGLGGTLGSGKQWFPWIEKSDLVALLVDALRNPEREGIYNAVAPEAVTNEILTKTLGSILKRPTLVPAPAFALRLAFGQMADEALLASQRVVPERLLETGVVFRYPTLRAALDSILTS